MRKLITVAILTATLAGCSSIYYGTMERFGVQKREILVDRVEEVRSAQEEGQEQFRSALDQYRAVVDFDGGNLEDQYNRLRDEYEDSKAAADKIRERINEVEEVAERLFDEWENELEEYDNAGLKADSARQLETTRRSYSRLMTSMHNSEERLEPALTAMHDQVLFLKHNLNAAAIASLRLEAATVARDVDALLASMQRSIQEADEFLQQM